LILIGCGAVWPFLFGFAALGRLGLGTGFVFATLGAVGTAVLDSCLGHGLQVALAAVACDLGVKVLGHQSVVEPIEQRMGH
jgi:hypothetical protein